MISASYPAAAPTRRRTVPAPQPRTAFSGTTASRRLAGAWPSAWQPAGVLEPLLLVLTASGVSLVLCNVLAGAFMH